MPPPQTQSFRRLPLNAVFGSQAHVRLLRELIAAEAPLSTVQLARACRLTPAGARRALVALETTGVIKRLGERSQMSAFHAEHPLASGLHALFDSEHAAWAEVGDALQASVQHDTRVIAAYAYGSVARGDDTAASDLDLALVARATPDVVADEIAEQLHALRVRHGLALSVIGITLAEVRSKSARGDAWWRSIVRDGWVLKGKPPGRLVE